MKTFSILLFVALTCIARAADTYTYQSSRSGGVTQTNASIVRQLELTAASNALVSFSVSTTNSSIVRQLEATALSNAVIAYVETYANAVTNSSIVRQLEATALSNAVIAYVKSEGALSTNYTDSRAIALSNAPVLAGSGASNAFVGGVIFKRVGGLFTNLNAAAATLTNLDSVVVAAHTLTNNGDTIRAEWAITRPAALVNTNQFQIIYGSQTLLDTGLMIGSNSPVRAWCEITRTGNTSQHVEARLEWGPGGGAPFAFTNANIEIAQTNGINTTLKMMGAARRVGAFTNNFFRLTYEPYSR